VTDLVRYLRERQPDFLSDLAELVNLDCGTNNKGGVDEAGARMQALFTREGWRVRAIPLPAHGDCLQATLVGSGRARILLLGHLDTVYPDGTAAQRPMTVRDGRIYGPGTNDMKAGLLSGLYAVTALRVGGWDDFAELTFFCNSDEEVGSPASVDLYSDVAKRADAALVLEAARADGSIVSARKGGGHFQVQVTGRSAHAGVEPHKGANAILELAHHVQALQALNGVRPGVTVNVGVVRGGTVSNAVADLATADVDVRVARPEDIPVLDDALRRAVAWRHVPGTAVTLSGSFGAWPMARTPAIALMAALACAEAAALGIDLRDVATGGMSDANKVAAMGTPVLDGLGPVGGLDHSPGEYVELDSLVPRTALLAGLIRALAGNLARLQSLRHVT
jgi:glutamate carboxypeptidase